MSQRNSKPIDEALKKHYASKSLSDRQLEQLMGMQEALATEPANKAFQNYRYAFYAAACSLFVCLVVTFSLINQAPLSQRVMDEIAYNHQQNMPIEVASSSLEDIRRYLNKLNFPIISPSALSRSNWAFLGGRYCSINGKLAAQLKIKNLTDNKVYTLYQAATEAGLEASGKTRLTDMIDGVGVSIWRERGLLLGLASSP
ncbi:MAG: hypothetical protein ACPG47_08450 [Leucothrix sp.]